MIDMSFVASIIASIVATLLVAAVAGYTFRGGVARVMSRLLGLDLRAYFDNTLEAERDLKSCISEAKSIRILVSRGQSLSTGALKFAFESSGWSALPQILLADLEIPPGQTDWADLRAREVEFDPQFRKGALRHQTVASEKLVENLVNDGKCEVRYYNQPHLARIILTDEWLFFNPYLPRRHGKDCPVLKYGRRDPLYDWATRYFELIWDAARRHVPFSEC